MVTVIVVVLLVVNNSSWCYFPKSFESKVLLQIWELILSDFDIFFAFWVILCVVCQAQTFLVLSFPILLDLWGFLRFWPFVPQLLVLQRVVFFVLKTCLCFVIVVVTLVAVLLFRLQSNQYEVLVKFIWMKQKLPRHEKHKGKIPSSRFFRAASSLAAFLAASSSNSFFDFCFPIVIYNIKVNEKKGSDW